MWLIIALQNVGINVSHGAINCNHSSLVLLRTDFGKDMMMRWGLVWNVVFMELMANGGWCKIDKSRCR